MKRSDPSPKAQARIEDALGKLAEARQEKASLLARIAEADRLRDATIIPFPKGGRGADR